VWPTTEPRPSHRWAGFLGLRGTRGLLADYFKAADDHNCGVVLDFLVEHRPSELRADGLRTIGLDGPAQRFHAIVKNPQCSRR
jgi:hypothetical protein